MKQAQLPEYVFMHNDHPKLRLNSEALLLFPGNVPRHTSMNAGSEATIYVTFDLHFTERTATAASANSNVM